MSRRPSGWRSMIWGTWWGIVAPVYTCLIASALFAQYTLIVCLMSREMCRRVDGWHLMLTLIWAGGVTVPSVIGGIVLGGVLLYALPRALRPGQRGLRIGMIVGLVVASVGLVIPYAQFWGPELGSREGWLFTVLLAIWEMAYFGLVGYGLSQVWKESGNSG